MAYFGSLDISYFILLSHIQKLDPEVLLDSVSLVNVPKDMDLRLYSFNCLEQGWRSCVDLFVGLV
jgi:hypothetical protein